MPHPTPEKKPASAARVRPVWLAVLVLMICVIWGNSLVPGDDSGSLSLAVLGFLKGGLASLGIPSGWLTHHLVRKAAHFTEYLVLGLVAMQAFVPHRTQDMPRRARLARAALTACVLVAVPSVDEGIVQRLLSVGRSGQLTDVLIDCAGAATGCALTLAASALLRRHRRRHAPAPQAPTQRM